jgi:hypothetical protein
MKAETVALNFPKRCCLVTFGDAEPSTDFEINHIGIIMKLALLSMKFFGCMIFVDHRVLICRAGDTVLSCGDTNITLHIGWSIFTFDETPQI